MVDTGAAVDEQRRLYGAPVGELVREICTELDLTQAAAARILGLSPAMLSQLVSAQRVKIGNPLVVNRLQALLEVSFAAGDLTREELRDRLDEIRESNHTVATLRTPVAQATPAPPVIIAQALRTVASGQELSRAIAAVEPVAPNLAHLLRAYGLGSEDEAAAHWATITETGK